MSLFKAHSDLSSEEQQLLLRLQQGAALAQECSPDLDGTSSEWSLASDVLAGGMTDASKRRLSEVSAPAVACKSGYASTQRL